MAALDLLGRRWCLRVIWELRDERCLSFRDLQAACEGLSPSVLNKRLAELRAADVVEHAGGYCLTERGRALMSALRPLHDWAESWGRD